jgi:uncharacterized protein (DUF2141 family)
MRTMIGILAVTAALAGAAASSLASETPAAATLTITITGIVPAPSDLRIGLYDEANYEGAPKLGQNVPAVAPQTVVTFKDLPPGRLAVKILQDLNGNGEMDSTMFGVPEEPFGLSNDIKPQMSAPGFDETGFELKPGENVISITMQQM